VFPFLLSPGLFNHSFYYSVLTSSVLPIVFKSRWFTKFRSLQHRGLFSLSIPLMKDGFHHMLILRQLSFLNVFFPLLQAFLCSKETF
jgi:hypothetical protein